MDLVSLLAQPPSSARIADHLKELGGSSPTTNPDVKIYSDAIYYNYYLVGLSFLYIPVNGYKPTTGSASKDLDLHCLRLDSIIVYNVTKPSGEHETPSVPKQSYSPYPSFPLTFPTSAQSKRDSQSKFDIDSRTTGKEFVAALGEPDRKGGGAGPSSGSIGIWLEWSKLGLMVELGGSESKGPQAWEKGKDAVWSEITIFSPSTSAKE